MYQPPVFYARTPNVPVMDHYSYPPPSMAPLPSAMPGTVAPDAMQPPPPLHAHGPMAPRFSEVLPKQMYTNSAPPAYHSAMPSPGGSSFVPYVYSDANQYYGYSATPSVMSVYPPFPMMRNYGAYEPKGPAGEWQRTAGRHGGPMRTRNAQSSGPRQAAAVPSPPGWQPHTSALLPAKALASPSSSRFPPSRHSSVPLISMDGEQMANRHASQHRSATAPDASSARSRAAGDAYADAGAFSENQRQGTRSNYVMWCGNVPSDATLEELWSFFTDALDIVDEPTEDVDHLETRVPIAALPIPPRPSGKRYGSNLSGGAVPDAVDSLDYVDCAPDGKPSSVADDASDVAHVQSPQTDNRAGILSIFIISRSSCAFVNYESQEALERACLFFHGRQLRIKPSCPRLVCRPRKLEDAEYAGVAAQRGKGVHTNWYRELRRTSRERAFAAVDPRAETPYVDAARPVSPALSTASRSFASTNSSLLRQPAFAHRFFILKSRSREALNEALETKLWCTQPHNEAVLNQAFRNSDLVTLLFSENFSGQFFGYAHMASLTGGLSLEDADALESNKTNAAPESPRLALQRQKIIQSFSAQAERGPLPDNWLKNKNDAADRGSPDGTLLSRSPSTAAEAREAAALEKSAIERNRRLDEAANDADGVANDAGSAPANTPAHAPSAHTRSPQRNPAEEPFTSNSSDLDHAMLPAIHEPRTLQTGRPFFIRWINTKALPFAEIQNLRNPWRDNRLIKVSRDGTELEPHVGEQLVALWETYAKEP
ncbi:hypothetical protein MSPP1_003778 [Malassezia sp. CBS 17886]|nr:hypothetical protein MSPP1_003778 [Malassezia sp. CBS 17886]